MVSKWKNNNIPSLLTTSCGWLNRHYILDVGFPFSLNWFQKQINSWIPIATGCSFNFLLLEWPTLRCSSVLYNISVGFYFFTGIIQEKMFAWHHQKKDISSDINDDIDVMQRPPVWVIKIEKEKLVFPEKLKAFWRQSNMHRMWQNVIELQFFQPSGPAGAGYFQFDCHPRCFCFTQFAILLSCMLTAKISHWP